MFSRRHLEGDCEVAGEAKAKPREHMRDCTTKERGKESEGEQQRDGKGEKRRGIDEEMETKKPR